MGLIHVIFTKDACGKMIRMNLEILYQSLGVSFFQKKINK